MNASLLVDKAQLQGDEVVVEGDDYRHLFRSRRLTVGDALRVVDGHGSIRSAVVNVVERGQARVVLGEPLSPPEVPTQVSIWSAVPRPERASWMVEKGTELGVREFVFFDAQRSARKINQKGLARLGRVAKSAILQCGGAWLPKFGVVDSFTEAARTIGEISSTLPCYVLLPAACEPLAAIVDEASKKAQLRKVVIMVGPEGDFVDQEVASLSASGARPVLLGNQVLRMETAAVVAAGLLLAR